MASKTVKSPAGEQIEIVPDDEWLEATGGNEFGLRQWASQRTTKPYLLRALWEHGEFTDAGGRVGLRVREWISEKFPKVKLGGPTTFMALWRNPLNNPAVVTRVNGKRTYSMKLVAMPEMWHRKLLRDIAASPGPTPQPAPEAPQEAPEAPQPAPEDDGLTVDEFEALVMEPATELEEPLGLELQVAQQVAMSLLTTVVEIISTGKADIGINQRLQIDLQETQVHLAERLQENQRLRNQLREVGDTIVALRQERDGLRSRLRQTEHNLSEALKGDTAQAVNSEILKRVDEIMRTAPTSKGD